MLTKSQVYAIVRETINYRKDKFDTLEISAHVEDPSFASNLDFIRRHSCEIFIQQPDLLLNISAHLASLEYIFNLPKTLEEEYAYCVSRNEF